MTKQEFLSALCARLSGLPEREVQDRLSFYREMIEDRMEEGVREEEAVAQIGTPEEVAAQIIAETPFSKLVKQKLKPKRALSAWEITLIILGFPIWGALAISVFAIFISLAAAAAAVVFSLYASTGAIALGAVAGAGLSVYYLFAEGVTLCLVALGTALVLLGLSIFLYYGSKALAKGTGFLIKATVRALKTALVKKGGAAQ